MLRKLVYNSALNATRNTTETCLIARQLPYSEVVTHRLPALVRAAWDGSHTERKIVANLASFIDKGVLNGANT